MKSVPAGMRNWKLPAVLVGLAWLLAALGCASAAPAQPTSTPPPQPTATSWASLTPPPEEVSSLVELPQVGTGVGERIPDFAINLADGSTVTSQDLLVQEQATFLFFFATW